MIKVIPEMRREIPKSSSLTYVFYLIVCLFGYRNRIKGKL
jgi:hypothetical protein